MIESRIGAVAREKRAAALDAWLTGLYDGAGAPADGCALVATGGLGRRECAPYGDVDLLLLHRGTPGIGELAHRLWYPIWDAKVGLDHATRTVPESLSVAIEDVRVALSLLDIRYIAGDPVLADQLRRAGLDQWRRTAGRGMVRLREAGASRAKAHGELAFLLEGDLKEAAGGLRDVQVLRAIAVLGVADVYRPPVRAAHARLLDTRDALHVAAGRRVDRLIAQERPAVASSLGIADEDALLRRVSTDARAITYALHDAWRAVDRWRSPVRTPRTPVARDVVAQDGEIVLARAAIGATPDSSLSLRVAAAAAKEGIPIARATLEWLSRFVPPLPTPWPDDARRSFLALLGSAANLAGTWDACDRYGLIGSWLPEWNRLR
ncbi:MAG TPA: [protein-PII] uridylyltransferase, partial [Micromonosporaceae bacterium]